MKKKDDEPSVWLTVIKLLLGLIVLVGGTGLALWYMDQQQQHDLPALGTSSGIPDWGIAGDSPLRGKR